MAYTGCFVVIGITHTAEMCAGSAAESKPASKRQKLEIASSKQTEQAEQCRCCLLTMLAK